MSTAVMTQRVVERSPKSLARMAGLFQFLEGTIFTYGQVIVLGKLVVQGNAQSTATNFLGHERLFWLGFACCMAGIVFHVIWALLMYDLLKPVHRRMSLAALVVMLVGCGVQAITTVLYLAPLLLLRGGSALNGFTTEQLQSLAYAFVRLNGYAFDAYLFFFGAWCFLTGLLIFKSTFLPKVLGILLAIAGMGWMMYIVPPIGIRLFPAIAVASGMGEIPVQLWLLIAGVNAEKWQEQARLAYA